MTKLEKVSTSHNGNFMGGWCFLYLCKNNLQDNANKSYHVQCKVIVVLHIYHTILVSDKQDLLQTKFKVWPLSNFELYNLTHMDIQISAILHYVFSNFIYEVHFHPLNLNNDVVPYTTIKH